MHIEPFVDKEKLEEAEGYIKLRVKSQPKFAIVLGSGLGNFTDRMTHSTTINCNDIPWYPLPTVEGHKGEMMFGLLGETPIVAVKGRSHYYEGKVFSQITFAVQLFLKLGIEYLILTNAAGSVRSDLKPGSFVIISDYINFTQIEVLPKEFKFKNNPFSNSLLNYAKQTALEVDITFNEGVYCWTSGPSYETPAEVKLLNKLGCDVVGMSTIPEAIVAAYLGLEVLSVSLVTNFAAGIDKLPPTHEAVQRIARNSNDSYSEFISAVIQKINVNKNVK